VAAPKRAGAAEPQTREAKGEFASGTVKGEEIVCPRHGARFNIKPGKVTAPPAYEDIATFPVRKHEGRIQVRDDRWG
jgi:3-phenylpropionate/trans-cinnamate dioxygenase ferredoxin subunit